MASSNEPCDQEAAAVMERAAQEERGLIQRALICQNHSRSRTAKVLGISRVTLYKKMKRYGLLGQEKVSLPEERVGQEEEI